MSDESLNAYIEKNAEYHRSAIMQEGARLHAENERLREELESFVRWAQAYPIDVFSEPDLKRAHELLLAGGMALDAVSASIMRRVVGDIGERARAALAGKAE